MCLWFGLVAGLAERVAYLAAPKALQPYDLWHSALLDLVLFTAIALPVLFLRLLVPRLNAAAVALFLCTTLLALDCATILYRPVNKPALVAAMLAVSAGAAWLFARHARPALAVLRASLFALAAYGVVYVGIWPLIAIRQEHKQAEQPAAPSGAPNVLVLVVDTLRADHLSTYGYARPTSPNLTRLAQKGVLFENAVAPASWTLPSHATLLTGRLPSEHRAGQPNWYLDGRYPTLGSAFEKMGYRTAAFSANPFLFSRRVGFGRGFQHFEDGSFLEKLAQTNIGLHIENLLARARLLEDIPGREDAATLNRNARRWMNEDEDARPFFAVITYFDVHEPFLPPAEFFHRFSFQPRPPVQFYWDQTTQLSDQQVREAMNAYDACIAYTDAQIDALLARLRDAGRLDNTIVVVTSDHGEAFNEQGFLFHGNSLHWNQIHVPLIVYAPGRAPAGARVGTPVALQSVPATLMEMAGAKTGDFPGPPLAALWSSKGKNKDWPYPVSELATKGDSPILPSYWGPMRSVVTPTWHFIEGGRSGHELYPCCGRETAEHNLAQRPEHSHIVAAIQQAMDSDSLDALDDSDLDVVKTVSARAEASPAAPEPPRPTPSDAELDEALRALGYQR